MLRWSSYLSLQTLLFGIQARAVDFLTSGKLVVVGVKIVDCSYKTGSRLRLSESTSSGVGDQLFDVGELLAEPICSLETDGSCPAQPWAGVIINSKTAQDEDCVLQFVVTLFEFWVQVLDVQLVVGHEKVANSSTLLSGKHELGGCTDRLKSPGNAYEARGGLFCAQNPFLLLLSSALREHRYERLIRNPVGSGDRNYRADDTAECAYYVEQLNSGPVPIDNPEGHKNSTDVKAIKQARCGANQCVLEVFHVIANSTARLQMGVGFSRIGVSSHPRGCSA